MRIAIMVNSLQFGGAERVMAELSCYLQGQGHQVFLFVMDDSDIAYPYGGELHRISLYYKKYSPLATLMTLQYPIMTYRFKKRFGIDITISAMEFLNVINLLTQRGDKVIPSMHNFRLQAEVTPTHREKLVEWLFAKLVPRAYRLVTVAEAISSRARELYAIPPQHVVTLYNAADQQRIRALARQPMPCVLSAFIAPPTFGWMGRLAEQKAADRLIVAFAKVADRMPGARLLMIGDGHLRSKLEALIEKLGLSSRVLITGFLKNPFAAIAACRAFVLSSAYEGFGNVLIEAMCCGVPVISCDCLCGPREILAPGTAARAGRAVGVESCAFGLLTAPHDGMFSDQPSAASDALAEAMLLLAQDDALHAHYAAASARRAEDFSPEALYPGWDALLRGDLPAQL